jgi:hypothetical protein
MATQYDGSVRIDTRINTTNFNAGMKKLKAAATDALIVVLNATNGVLLGLLRVRNALVAFGSFGVAVFKKLLLGGLLLFAVTAAKVFATLRESMQEIINLRGGTLAQDVEGIKNQFTELRYAVANAFLPLVEFAIPYIRLALDWLIRLFNQVAMITAAFIGQKEVMQVIAGSAQKIADANKKSEKAARGQLAAFDQISVLQKPQEAETSDLPKVATELVPITDDILQNVSAIKAEIAEWFADPEGKLKELGQTLSDGFKDFIFWEEWVMFFQRAWQRTVDFVKSEWDGIRTFFANTWEFIKADFALLGDFFKGIWDGVVEGISRGWNTAVELIQNGFATIGNVLENAKETWAAVADSWRQVLDGIIEFLTGVFTGNWRQAWDGITNIFDGILNGWKSIFKGAINAMIELINGLLRAVVIGINAVAEALSGINITIPDWVPGIGGSSLNFNIPSITAPQIPRLATGAVIPPNAEFAAILGDNKRENEILAPESTIRRIIQEELGSGSQTIDNVITLDGEVIYRNQKRVGTRHGKSLISGGVV